jgi:hypothetical protein
MAGTLNAAYKINFPNLASAPVKFDFTAVTPVGNFHLYFWWNNTTSLWVSWVVMPDGTIRNLGIYPNAINWKEFTNFSLYVGFTNNSIGFLDLPNVNMVILSWL